MKIEFSTIGDGTNVRIALLEELGGSDTARDSFYTRQHQFTICARPDKPEYMSCEQFFAYLEEVLPFPIIGGKYGHLHPYWVERGKKREQRAAVEQWKVDRL
jgi:hypothetical protein